MINNENNDDLSIPHLARISKRVRPECNYYEIPLEIREFAEWFFDKDPNIKLYMQANALDKLIRLDGFLQSEVFAILKWVKEGTGNDARFWRKVLGTFASLRNMKNGRRSDKFFNLKMAYDNVVNRPNSDWYKFKYKVFLASPEWEAMKQKVLKRDNYKCVKCSETGYLQVHHLKYPKDLYKDHCELLITLCDECHEKVHGL